MADGLAQHRHEQIGDQISRGRVQHKRDFKAFSNGRTRGEAGLRVHYNSNFDH